MNTETKTNSLILVLDDKDLFIEECDGKDLITEAKDVFAACIDDHFEALGFNIPFASTPETNFKVYELDDDLPFEKIFKSISKDLDKITFTPAQIINFCRKFRKVLPDNQYALLFLTRNNDHYFVVNSDVFSSGYGAEINPLHRPDVLMADDYYYIVVPT
ncbi:MAG: hypothetical protein WC164_02135 [Patescibacteria group bacterium]|nr:hypothetical protein [Patescibacteria group bacterium]